MITKSIDRATLIIVAIFVLAGIAILSVALITQRETSQATTGASGNSASTRQGNVAQLPTSVATAPPPMATGGLPTPASTYSPIIGTNIPATVARHEEPTPAYDPSRFTPSPIPPLRQASFGIWSYTASRDELGNLFVYITYDEKKVSSLQAFAEENKQMTAQVTSKGGQAEVYVTFRNYISPDEFRSWAKENAVSPQEVVLRSVSSNGERITLALVPPSLTTQGDDPLPQDILDEQLKSASQNSGQQTLKGVMYTRVKVDSRHLPTFNNDPRIFIADVTANIARNDLVAHGTADGAQARAVIHAPFWEMEDLGLGNFSK